MFLFITLLSRGKDQWKISVICISLQHFSSLQDFRSLFFCVYEIHKTVIFLSPENQISVNCRSWLSDYLHYNTSPYSLWQRVVLVIVLWHADWQVDIGLGQLQHRLQLGPQLRKRWSTGRVGMPRRQHHLVSKWRIKFNAHTGLQWGFKHQ